MWKKPYKGKRDSVPIYSLVIHRKSDVMKWMKEIGFKNPKHATKFLLWQKLGYCPPKTSLSQRKKLLKDAVLGQT